MLTKNEISTLNLSPTKKDFVQIWNELLEVAGKLSERWDPTSTNESDPGIVLLKALAGIADKLNYNIDKNTLEAFMPTAAQEDSMRKLCEMLGYNIKYYQSAQTQVTVKYHNPDPTDEENDALTLSNNGYGLLIPKFTVITNNDKDVNYFIIDDPLYRAPGFISKTSPVQTFVCMEGQLVRCESTSDNYVITANQISSDNRFYFPETEIAENGIFVYNVMTDSANNLVDGAVWKPVDNLNIQVKDSRVFKFGFDSYASRPYIEFPEDYSKLFNEGLFIYYTRTSGAGGNISPRVLTQIELPNTAEWADVSDESFIVENVFSANTGSDIETIQQAYNNFKKTIGTFETLVTCRDYMNKIYNMVNTNNKPYVSNILVTDIRNDLNRAVTICSCDDAGIFYKETPIIERTTEIKTTDIPINLVAKDTVEIRANKPWYDATKDKWYYSYTDSPEIQKGTLFPSSTESTKYNNNFVKLGSYNITISDKGFYVIEQGTYSYTTGLKALEEVEIPIEETYTATELVNKDTPAINRFDIVLYPYKSYNQIKNNVRDIRAIYDASFEYSTTNLGEIKQSLEAGSTKTIAHNLVTPREGDLVSINNYLRLNATIATNTKVSEEECSIIINNIKIALANAFNMRELDFGEEIPFENLVGVIENADPRVKTASLTEPDLYTTFTIVDSITNNTPKLVEYAVASNRFTLSDAESTKRLSGTFNTTEAKQWYNKLVVRNILAGRVPLFKYNNLFKTNFSEGSYQETRPIDPSDTQFPSEMPEPTESDPIIIWKDDETDTTIIGQLVPNKPGDSEGDTENPDGDGSSEENPGENPPDTGEGDSGSNDPTIDYDVIYTPNDFKDNIITDIEDDTVTDIDTYCNIPANDNGEIEDISLSEGEFIRFKAPNLTTTKTYPAYVNYHLDLGSEIDRAAENAKASSLYDILNSDWSTWSASNPKIKWEKVLTYFKNTNRSCVKTFKLTQKIAAYVETDFDSDPADGEQSSIPKQSSIQVMIGNTAAPNAAAKMEELLAQSGCVKLRQEDHEYVAGKGYRAEVVWDRKPGQTVSSPYPNLEIYIDFDNHNPFISNAQVLSDIQSSIDTYLQTYKDAIKLPTECDWIINFSFECVPFNSTSFNEWEKYLKANRSTQELFESIPVEENGTLLWRLYDGAYQDGKYIINDSNIGSGKLLKFDRSYFGNLNIYDKALRGVYVAEGLGKDIEPNFIENNEEYKLGPNEYLYIEYTPSSTNEDSTDALPVTEIYGAGTIIKPTGFEAGSMLMDSDVYKRLGNTPHKTVTFKTQDSSNHRVEMYRFNANEQVEIRDYAKVDLSKDFLNDSSAIYIYKNFNNCDALEVYDFDKTSLQRINNTYTLKDGEYIFYTDEKKAEFAYFTTGTQVTLSGKVVIPKFDIVDLNTIFDSGIQEIPWQRVYFNNNDIISFQEYQYITLGNGDTLKKLKLISVPGSTVPNRHLGSTPEDSGEVWRFCDEVEYVLKSNPTETKTLPKLSLGTGRYGNGWEATSVLELNVSKNNSQTLHNNGKVSSGLILSSTSSGGALSKTKVVSPKEGQDLSFKTNVTCQSSGTNLNIDDVFANPDKDKSFKLKLFTENPPSILKTKPGKVVPLSLGENSKVDPLLIFKDTNARQLSKKSTDLWSSVSLDKLKVNKADDDNPSIAYDGALVLAPSLIADTYGIFCVYINYTSTDAVHNARTWIETLPGTNQDDFKLLNAESTWEMGTEVNQGNKLFLHNGLNCICINKSNTFFIKTSEASQGVLYFDDIRLIDNIVKNTEADGTISSIKTQGLNLEQLGYFYVPSAPASAADTTALELLETESQLLDEIKAIDKDGEFYYNVPIDPYLAIDLNESSADLNTLRNPRINYDVNNINNSFVISKLDIDYLDRGLRIARSSIL
jgi:hypothetical protein